MDIKLWKLWIMSERIGNDGNGYGLGIVSNDL